MNEQQNPEYECTYCGEGFECEQNARDHDFVAPHNINF